MGVYVNNMLVKTLRIEDHVKHFEDVFQILRRYRIRLNPLKCALELKKVFSLHGKSKRHRG